MLRQCEQYLLIRPFRSLALRDFVGGVARQGQCCSYYSFPSVACRNIYGWPEPYVFRHIRCIYGIFGREITIHMVIYGADIRFWPTLVILSSVM